jgi:hypothetical protein
MRLRVCKILFLFEYSLRSQSMNTGSVPKKLDITCISLELKNLESLGSWMGFTSMGFLWNRKKIQAKFMLSYNDVKRCTLFLHTKNRQDVIDRTDFLAQWINVQFLDS